MLRNELLDGCDKSARHRLHGVGGGNLGLSLLPDKPQRPFDDLQPRDDGVQVHSVDGLDLQNYVLA